MRKIVNLIANAWALCGLTLLLFLFIEGSFFAVFLIRDYNNQPIHSLAVADTYSGTSWVQEYYKELSRTQLQWTPYTYWRGKPFQGKFINIDSDGIRLTPETAIVQKKIDTALKVFVFGGSTLWGMGARDAFTIPAILARELRSKGVAAEIINFGERGYVSTQEVISLFLQLQKGSIPDVVIFYDGINDTFSAYQDRVAGLPQNEFNRSIEFNLSSPDKLGTRIKMDLQDMVRGLSTLRFLKYLLRLSGVIGPESRPITQFLSVNNSASANEALAREVVTTYWSNVELVTALSEHYHFTALFYWQPSIFHKQHLTDHERTERRKQQDLEAWYLSTDDVMGQAALSKKPKYRFQDLSMIFADMREPLFVDFCHLGEFGNEIIAKRIEKDVLSLVGFGKSAVPQSTTSSDNTAAIHHGG